MRPKYSTHQKQRLILFKISAISILSLSGLLVEQGIKASSALAQAPTINDSKALADSLLKEGQQQWKEIPDLLTSFNLKKEGFPEQNYQVTHKKLWEKEEASMKTLQKALIIYQKINDLRGQLNVLRTPFHNPNCHFIGAAYLKSESCIKSAFEYYKLTFQIASKLEDNQSKIDVLYKTPTYSLAGFGFALSDLGFFYAGARNYDKAAYYFKWTIEASKEIQRDNENKFSEILFLTAAQVNLGIVYNRAGNYSRALEAFIEVIPDQYTDSFYNMFYSEIDKALGNAYFSIGEYNRHISFLESVLSAKKGLVSPSGSSDLKDGILSARLELDSLYFKLASLYLRAENYEKSIFYCQQLLNDSTSYKGNQATHKQDYQQTALNILGMAYLKKQDNQKAIEYFQKVLAISGAAKIDSLESDKNVLLNDHEILALRNLGKVYHISGEQDQAIKYLQKAWHAKQNIFSGARHDLSFIFEQYSDPEDELTILIELSDVFASSKKTAKATEFYQKVLSLSQAVKSRRFQALALKGLGTIAFQSGNLVEAEKLLRQGIDIQESLRAGLGARDANKVQLFEEQNGTYRTLQQVLVAQNKFPEALEISERGRARAFAELLASKQITNPNAQPALTPLTFVQIQQIAKERNATIVEYSIVSSDKIYIYVIKPTGKIEFQPVDLKALSLPLEKLVRLSRQSIGVRGRGDSIELVALADVPDEGKRLHQLYDLLIQPIAAHLPADPTAHVIFIPQDELFLVPFAALQDPAGNYLIKDHTLLAAPSIQVVQLTHQQHQSQSGGNQAALVVGDPTMPKITVKVGTPPIQLSDLAGAKQEALEVAQILHTKALTGNEATKATVLPQLATASMVHLATHGLIDDFRGLGVPGAIALAPAGNGELNDGLLTANEILDMKLKAELVVLSACDTGRGRVTGDGVIGLSRSLIAAGVPSVLVSLWSVPDAPTAELMTTFYRSLQQQKSDKAQALRQAMLTTMKTHPNPKDWAAFTLIGESE